MISDFWQHQIIRLCIVSALFLALYGGALHQAIAASLSLTPDTGVHSAGNTFSARVVVHTDGKPVNAAEGTLSFNPQELSVVTVNRTNSIFNLWVAEPTFSNTAGTISFSGGVPSGYTGQSGTVMTVIFRAAGAGTARVSFTNGSVLANDGRGTNILTNMNGGAYTIQAKSAAPEPEVIEYVAPANTPSAPQIRSDTHPNPNHWYARSNAKLNWVLPNDVTAVRTLLDQNPTTIPTKVYEDPISTVTVEDLPEGVSYLHVQFQNGEGWGKVSHYRLGVDTQKPESIEITRPDTADLASPHQILEVSVSDETTNISRYKVKVDANEPFEYVDKTGSSTIPLPELPPGYHTVIIEAFDEAGNSIIGTYSFTITAFEKPIFTEYPSEVSEEVIPVIKGSTRPDATVTVTVTRVGGQSSEYLVTAGSSGEFTFIPEGTFSTGVYELTAVATDVHGAQSAVSDTVRIAVQQPGYIRIGSLLVSALSVIVPLLVLLVLLILGISYGYQYLRSFRKRVRTESIEALEILRQEFTELQRTLRTQEANLQESRKNKQLTKAEARMIEEFDRSLQNSQQKVEKEIVDVTRLTRKRKK